MDIHKEFPKTVKRDDFWRQIKRTVNGEPVSERDIQAIVDTIKNQLKLDGKDYHLLDLGCGNAALASRLFDFVARYTGVDFSEYLVEVAKDYFSDPKVEQYIVSDILAFMERSGSFPEYTHVLCYGVMSYLPYQMIGGFFRNIGVRMPNVKTVFIGNLPEKSKAEAFHARRGEVNFELHDHTSAIGVWWGQDEICELAKVAGWKPIITKMPEGFYASEYRFDLTLQRE